MFLSGVINANSYQNRSAKKVKTNFGRSIGTAQVVLDVLYYHTTN